MQTHDVAWCQRTDQQKQKEIHIRVVVTFHGNAIRFDAKTVNQVFALKL